MRFFLGTHKPHWLGLTDVPLFVSRRSLARYRTPPVAKGPWALDSGAFTVLDRFGQWDVCPQTYAREVSRWAQEVGHLQWAAVQDWPCEERVLRQTGLTIQAHQRRTVESYLSLHDLAPDLPWVPVLQGWRVEDYLRHVDDYDRVGVVLSSLPLVGLGSVCRRQATGGVEGLVARLWTLGIRLHGFGLKLKGLARVARYLTSSDSLAWSYDARRGSPLPGCPHQKCANCLRYALRWREKVLRVVGLDCGRPRQPVML